jgi:ankyrin repeat protein
MDNDSKQTIRTLDQLGRELVYAAYNGNESKCRTLLAEGADINYCEDNMHLTPLMAAAKAGNSNCIKLLVERGADKSIKDNVGETAHDIYIQRYALNSRRLDSVLIDQILAPSADRIGQAFKKAAGNLDEMLLRAAGDGDVEKCAELLKAGANVNYQDKNLKKTALMIACEKGNDALIAFLVGQNADRGLRDTEYRTAVHLLIEKQLGSPATLELMLKDFEDHHTKDDLRRLNGLNWGYNRHQQQYHFKITYETKLDLVQKYRRNPHEIEFPTQHRYGLNLRKIFNFESYERITVSLDNNGEQNGLCIQPFAHVQNDPDLEKAYNLSVKYGGTPDEEKVFENRINARNRTGLTLVNQ